MRRAVGLAAAILALTALPARAPAQEALNPVLAENSQPGTTRWDLNPPRHPVIEGYSSEPSVAPGQAFHLHVRAPAGDRYRILVYRLGWYGGDGGRLVQCIPGCDIDEPATAQPDPPPADLLTGRVDAGWAVTDLVVTGSGWTSGYYLAQLRVTAGPDEGALGRVPLVVRAAPDDHAAILVQVPVNTWQAYDNWGGHSLYPPTANDEPPEPGDPTAGGPAVKVSFNRPYAEAVAVKVPFVLELPAVRFLEREGYDMSYATDVDVDRTPDLLLRHRLVMSVGHDEYWSGAMRTAWDHALHRGTNLALLGANAAYWQVRYEDAHRTLVEYRSSLNDPVKDPYRHTLQFRALRPARPECRLFGGVMYQYYAQRPASADPSGYTVAAPADDPWLAGTGLDAGDELPGVVGYEWDGLVPDCFQGTVTTLLRAEAQGVDGMPHHAHAVRGLARSGARVFATGSLEYSWGLDAYGGHRPIPALQQLTRNALADLTVPAAPRSVAVVAGGRALRITVSMRAPDPRLRRTLVYRHPGPGEFDPLDPAAVLVCESATGRCGDRPPRGTVRYAAVATDRWGRSAPAYSRPVRSG